MSPEVHACTIHYEISLILPWQLFLGWVACPLIHDNILALLLNLTCECEWLHKRLCQQISYTSERSFLHGLWSWCQSFAFLWGSWTRGAFFAVAGRMLVDCKHVKCFAVVIESVWICLPWMMHIWFQCNCRAVCFLGCVFVCAFVSVKLCKLYITCICLYLSAYIIRPLL